VALVLLLGLNQHDAGRLARTRCAATDAVAGIACKFVVRIVITMLRRSGRWSR